MFLFQYFSVNSKANARVLWAPADNSGGEVTPPPVKPPETKPPETKPPTPDYVAELAKLKAEKEQAQMAAKAEIEKLRGELDNLGKEGDNAKKYYQSNADDSKEKPLPLNKWPERLVAQYKEKGETLPEMDDVVIGG